MFRLPEDLENAEAVYGMIESGGTGNPGGGQYPIGKNHFWHSGVHIHGGKPIHPMIDGTIAACRITGSFAGIPRLKDITSEERDKLSDLEKSLYKLAGESRPDDGVYTLQYENLDKEAFDKLKEERTGIEDWFEEKEGKYEPVEKLSSEYILLKHHFDFPEYKNNTETVNAKTINFFTLYMGICTFIKNLKEYYDGFNAVGGSITGKITVFQKWVFRLKNAPLKHYKDLGGFKVFEYSTCTFKPCVEDASEYNCTFTNDEGETKKCVQVPIECITETKNLYKSKTNAKAYKIPGNGTMPGIETADIKQNRNFYDIQKWNQNDNYYKVVVEHEDCGSYNPSLCGWIRLKEEQKNKEPFLLEAGQYAYDIVRINTMPSDYCIVKTSDYYKYKNMSVVADNMPPEQRDRLKIFRKLPFREDGTLYTFYYNDEEIKPETINDSEYLLLFPYIMLPTMLLLTSKINIYKWSRVHGFEPGDYAKTVNISNQILLIDKRVNLPPYVTRSGSITFCGFSYRVGGSEYNAVMRKEDLSMDSCSGYLENKPHNNALNNFLTGRMKGCILYDSYTNSTSRRNARACIEEQKDLFEMDDPYLLLENFQVNKAYPVKHEGTGRFLLIENGVTVEAKIEYKEEFKDRSSIITPNMEVKPADILGYIAPVQTCGDTIYDLALFFDDQKTNENLFAETKWENYLKTKYFIIPENCQSLYKHVENNIARADRRFSSGSVFKYTREGEAYKLRLKSVRIHLPKSCFVDETDSNEADNIEEVASPPDSNDCFFDNNRIGNKEIINNEKFAEYFKTAKDKLVGQKLRCFNKGKKDYNEGFPLVEIDMDIFLKEFGELIYYTITDANLELNEAERTLTVSQNDIDNKIITTYDNDPFGAFQIVSLEDHKTLKQGMELRNPVRELGWYEDNVKKYTYLEFKAGGETCYLRGDANGKYEIEEKNYLNWEEYFTVMEKSGEENSINCDHNRIVEAIGEQGMNFTELLEIYSSADMEKREKLRKLVCRHHLEWNKDLYGDDFLRNLELEGESLTHFQAAAEKLDLWMPPEGDDRAKNNAALPPKGQVWFAHPVYFINHLDRAGLLDKTFNPYNGIIIPAFGYPNIEVKSNPGFAPISNNTTDYENNGVYYCGRITSPFNVSRIIKGKPDIHAGVDFGTSEDTPIHSFIYAEVIHTNDHLMEGFGHHILLRSVNNPKYFYILGHLNRIAKGIIKDTIVSPKTIVGYVGNTGNSTAPHLHVQFMKADRVVDIFNGHNVINTYSTAYNPFDHSEPYRR